MRVRFLLDENIPVLLKRALLRREPRVDILRIGDPQAPPLGTSDPDLLMFLEQSKRLLITLNRASMPGHLRAHYGAGRHLWGVLWMRRDATIRQLVEDLLLIWEASEAEEWVDFMGDLPLWALAPAGLASALTARFDRQVLEEIQATVPLEPETAARVGEAMDLDTWLATLRLYRWMLEEKPR